MAVGRRAHGEFAAVHTHAAASVGGVGIILIRAADAAAGHIDGIHSVCGRDFVPVETEGDIVLNLNGILQANVTA